MKKQSSLFAVERVCCFLVGAFFLLSSIRKMSDPEVIPGLLARLPSIPTLPLGVRRTVAGALTGLESYVGIATLLRFQLRFSLTLASVLPAAFAVLVAPYYERLGGDCGCVWKWMPMAPVSGASLILRNTVLSSMALASLQLNLTRRAVAARFSG